MLLLLELAKTLAVTRESALSADAFEMVRRASTHTLLKTLALTSSMATLGLRPRDKEWR